MHTGKTVGQDKLCGAAADRLWKEPTFHSAIVIDGSGKRKFSYHFPPIKNQLKTVPLSKILPPKLLNFLIFIWPLDLILGLSVSCLIKVAPGLIVNGTEIQSVEKTKIKTIKQVTPIPLARSLCKSKDSTSVAIDNLTRTFSPNGAQPQTLFRSYINQL